MILSETVFLVDNRPLQPAWKIRHEEKRLLPATWSACIFLLLR